MAYNQQVAQQQKDLNNANSNKAGYVPLKVDGILGPRTQTAINNYGFNTQTGLPNNSSFSMPKNLNTVSADKAGGASIITPDPTTSNNPLGLTTNPNPSISTDPKANTDTLANLMNKMTGEGTAQATANDEAGVIAKEKVYKDLDVKQLDLDNKYNQQSEEIRKSFQGSTAGLNDTLNSLSRDYQSQRATIGINKALALNDYNSAVEIANAKVKAEFQPIKDQIDNLIKFQTYNQNTLSDKDKMLLAQKIDQENAKYESGLQLGLYKEKAKIDDSLISSGNIFSVQSPAKAITNPDGSSSLVSGYTVVAGDDPYNIAQSNGIDMAELSRLNPQIKDWRNVQPGQVLNLPDNSTENYWLKGKSSTQIQAYNSVPAIDRDIVRQLINGDALMADVVKSRGAAGTKDIARYVAEATAVDPNFSINSNKIKYEANKKWNDPNGKAFLNRSAMNTAMSHMATTYEAALALGNTKIPKYNEIANWASKNSGNPALTSFIYDLTALSGEIATAYKGGTAATDQETEKFYNAMSGGMSPTQFKGVFDNAAKLMAGKLRSVAQEYKQTTGAYPTDPIIQPYTLSELKGMGIDTSSIDEILKQQGYNIVPSDNATLSPYGLGIPAINNVLSQFGL